MKDNLKKRLRKLLIDAHSAMDDLMGDSDLDGDPYIKVCQRLLKMEREIAALANATPYEEKPAKEIERLRNLLEDVVNELDLSESAIEKHGPLGTAPSILVKEVLWEKDLIIRALKQGMVDVTLKPTTDADLMAELEAYCKMVRNALTADIHESHVSQIESILSKYRPVKALPVEPIQGPTPMYLKAQKLIWDEAIKEHQKLYQENQRLQCEVERLSKEK
jgi:CheY-like chemotaxis protein